MITYVVDASVILTSLLQTRFDVLKKVNKYFTLLAKGEIKMISTNFLKTEVANGLRFNLKDAEMAVKFFNDFCDLPIEIHKLSASLYEEGIYKSFKYNTTVYDTLYHILALDQRAVFLTCDEDYYKKAKRLGDIELVI